MTVNMPRKYFDKVIIKCDELLQIATGTLLQIAATAITTCDRYYKLRQPLFQIATGITNCNNRYYKLRQVLQL